MSMTIIDSFPANWRVYLLMAAQGGLILYILCCAANSMYWSLIYHCPISYICSEALGYVRWLMVLFIDVRQEIHK